MESQREPSARGSPLPRPQTWEWPVSGLASLNVPVSPPRKRRRHNPRTGLLASGKRSAPSLAAIEAGKAHVDNHLEIFSSRLIETTREPVPSIPRLPHRDWIELYVRNQHLNGRHFVVHQHDHPITGPHYDLRLQFSDTSSISFAIMYGLPGNANSRRPNRNAIETRVHNLWNHLIESASTSSGSLIIWDTGEYSILPYHAPKEATETDYSRSHSSDASDIDGMSESDKLKEAFQQRKIRLRLHGTRLPPNYTVTLRLTSDNDISLRPRRRSKTRKRRRNVACCGKRSSASCSSSPSTNQDTGVSNHNTRFAHHSDEEDETIRVTNAYPGATNSISSVHQRRWFLSLDRVNSGFEHRFDSSVGRYSWVRKTVEEHDGGRRLLGFEPFTVYGPEIERSVVTGRLGGDVFQDEGVENFVGRSGWRPILI
ncbi:hypothetical protein D8B26_004829 [Coccidioides posadasii str. Silveira]|uniref:Uncharacterized protein n=2 Tax=Coccidioides posadasii TaxID=199306 RepID=E9D6G2_COCPS|nr:conserved hypothetical protein [Coccidioides posadasii str. Silveira]KMM68525.1 hypothetical protein CPAG_04852 [Coccidioides posadasii RMSCC 3488]QVM10167.1 hypothetical protein D8B26_004829 [Coccidioides posadasii str. Silveira]